MPLMPNVYKIAEAVLRGNEYTVAECVTQRLEGCQPDDLKRVARRLKRMDRRRLKRILLKSPEKLTETRTGLRNSVTTNQNVVSAPPLTLETLNAAIKLIESQHAMPRGAL